MPLLREPLLDMFLTVKDVAELLSVAPRTVWRWARDGQFPAPVHLGRKTTRWRASDVQAYLDRSRPTATS